MCLYGLFKNINVHNLNNRLDLAESLETFGETRCSSADLVGNEDAWYYYINDANSWQVTGGRCCWTLKVGGLSIGSPTLDPMQLSRKFMYMQFLHRQITVDCVVPYSFSSLRCIDIHLTLIPIISAVNTLIVLHHGVLLILGPPSCSMWCTT